MKSEYEKYCEALETVKEAVKKGLVQSKNMGVWRPVSDFVYESRIKPEPNRVPLELNDWAGGPWWVRVVNSDNNPFIWSQITDINYNGLKILNGSYYQYKELVGFFERTRDFVNVEPCSKEVSE